LTWDKPAAYEATHKLASLIKAPSHTKFVSPSCAWRTTRRLQIQSVVVVVVVVVRRRRPTSSAVLFLSQTLSSLRAVSSRSCISYTSLVCSQVPFIGSLQ
jgi:hypothetical protein